MRALTRVALLAFACASPSFADQIVAVGAPIEVAPPVTTYNPHVAVVGVSPVDGSFVVVHDADLASGTWAIYARRFDASGRPLGSAQVNPTATSYAGEPQIAFDAAGNYAVAWDGARPSGPHLAWVRRYAADGTPASDETPVSLAASSWQAGTRLSMKPDGTLAVAWLDGDQAAAMAQVFSKEGARRYPTDITFATGQSLYGYRLSIAVDPGDGSFLVGWITNQGPSSLLGVTCGAGGGAFDALAQRFGADGQAIGSPVLLNAPEPGGVPRTGGLTLAPLGGDTFTAFWLRRPCGTPTAAAELWGRTVPAAGALEQPYVLVQPTTGGSAVVDDAGNAVVQWGAATTPTPPYTTLPFARVFDRTGAPRTDATPIPSGGSLAPAPGGGFVLAWIESVPLPNDPYGSVVRVMAQRYSVQQGQAPVVNAGNDQVVDEGASVTLHGTATGPAGMAYTWRQVAGPTVALSDAGTLSPFFTAPLVPSGVGGTQTLSFELTVSVGGLVGTASTNVVVKHVNHAPVANAGAEQAVNEGSAVTLSGTASYDPDADPIVSYVWEQTDGIPVSLEGAGTATATFEAPVLPGGFGTAAVLTFRLSVSDGERTGTASVSVRVEQVNHPPAANAGPPQTVDEGTSVALNAGGSADPDGDGIGYLWTQIGGEAVTLSDTASATPSFSAPRVDPGGATLTFRLVVTDAGGLSSQAEVSVAVKNIDDPPSCDRALALPPALWPPNHKLVPVRIVGIADPQRDHVEVRIVAVTQDEPVQGLGNGDTAPDAVLQGDKALLRVERAATGNGRVYRLHFVADDGRGESCTGAVRVFVPRSAVGLLCDLLHISRCAEPVVDDGQHYDSTRP